MISPLQASASRMPSSLLPEAVGPTMAGINRVACAVLVTRRW